MSKSDYFNWQKDFQLENERLPYGDEIWDKAYEEGRLKEYEVLKNRIEQVKHLLGNDSKKIIELIMGDK